MTNSNAILYGCGCFLFIIVINTLIGGFCFDYSLWCIFNKNVPWYADAIAGTVLGEFTIPIAVTCWIIKLCSITIPFIG